VASAVRPADPAGVARAKASTCRVVPVYKVFSSTKQREFLDGSWA
jgi:hypothetical protein